MTTTVKNILLLSSNNYCSERNRVFKSYFFRGRSRKNGVTGHTHFTLWTTKMLSSTIQHYLIT